MALFQIDLDYFKSVNDTFGHAAGDHVLGEVARILTRETRTTDMVARIGGDEFVVVLVDFGTAEQLEQVAHRIIDRVSDPIPFQDHICKIGASIGGTTVDRGTGQDADAILAAADAALYHSKEEGRGRYTLSQ